MKLSHSEGVMELIVLPFGRALNVEVGSNLLESLRRYEIPVSYSCMAGRCGTCRCKVVQGQVLESGREAKITNPNGDRHVLACMSVLTENCTIEIPEPDEVVTHPARVIKASVLTIDYQTNDVIRLRIRPAKPLIFSPGQYVCLQLAPEYIRPYSMAGLCTDEVMEFQVRLIPDGRVSGYIAKELKIGDSVRVMGPLGTAYLRKKHEGPMLCVAGGTGLAPVLSIVRGALEGGMKNQIHLYFGVRSQEDLYGAEQLNELVDRYKNLHVHTVVAFGKTGLKQRSGLVTDAVAQDWESLVDWKVYLCGSPTMVDAATFLSLKKGVAHENIYADAFYANST